MALRRVAPAVAALVVAVSERWLLAFARRGDLWLASPRLARERWVCGVSAIEIIE